MLKGRILLRIVEPARLTAAIFAVSTFGVLVPTWFRTFEGSAFVEPSLWAVLFLFSVPTGEESAKIFGVFEILAQDSGRIRVMDDVFAEDAGVRDDVVYE